MVLNSSAALELVEFKEYSPREHYGRFVLGPVPPGQGVTLGNTFRRILLNDLPGVAITAAKLNNVHTEFTTLPGVLESVVEIFLNLREVVFFHTFPSVLAPQGHIHITTDVLASASFPRHITIADMELPEGIACVDNTQHIATLVQRDANFSLTVVLEEGTGYRVWKKPTQPQGVGFYPPRGPLISHLEEVKSGVFQPIDGNFMPVKLVNFTVHEMPPEGEYVHFEIVTNGSLHPREALRQAGLLLREFTRATLEDTPPVVMEQTEATLVSAQVEPKDAESFESIPIEQLELSLRAYNCLKRAEILTLGELATQSYASLLALRNFGQKSAEEVRKALATYNIELPQER